MRTGNALISEPKGGSAMFKKRLCLFAVLFPTAVFAVTIDELGEAVSDDAAAIKQSCKNSAN